MPGIFRKPLDGACNLKMQNHGVRNLKIPQLDTDWIPHGYLMGFGAGASARPDAGARPGESHDLVSSSFHVVPSSFSPDSSAWFAQLPCQSFLATLWSTTIKQLIMGTCTFRVRKFLKQRAYRRQNTRPTLTQPRRARLVFLPSRSRESWSQGVAPIESTQQYIRSPKGLQL